MAIMTVSLLKLKQSMTLYSDFYKYINLCLDKSYLDSLEK